MKIGISYDSNYVFGKNLKLGHRKNPFTVIKWISLSHCDLVHFFFIYFTRRSFHALHKTTFPPFKKKKNALLANWIIWQFQDWRPGSSPCGLWTKQRPRCQIHDSTDQREGRVSRVSLVKHKLSPGITVQFLVETVAMLIKFFFISC